MAMTASCGNTQVCFRARIDSWVLHHQRSVMTRRRDRLRRLRRAGTGIAQREPGRPGAVRRGVPAAQCPDHRAGSREPRLEQRGRRAHTSVVAPRPLSDSEKRSKISGRELPLEARGCERPAGELLERSRSPGARVGHRPRGALPTPVLEPIRGYVVDDCDCEQGMAVTEPASRLRRRSVDLHVG
jgi:hypothetical protein